MTSEITQLYTTFLEGCSLKALNLTSDDLRHCLALWCLLLQLNFSNLFSQFVFSIKFGTILKTFAL